MNKLTLFVHVAARTKQRFQERGDPRHTDDQFVGQTAAELAAYVTLPGLHSRCKTLADIGVAMREGVQAAQSGAFSAEQIATERDHLIRLLNDWQKSNSRN